MEPRQPTHPQTTRLLVRFWDDHIVRCPVASMFFISTHLHLTSSVAIPWFTIREVKVDVEIASSFFSFVQSNWPHIERSRHRRWLSFDLNVVCNKACWRELAEVPLWSTTPLELYRMSSEYSESESAFTDSVLQRRSPCQRALSYLRSPGRLYSVTGWKPSYSPLDTPVKGDSVRILTQLYVEIDLMALQFAGVSNTSALYKRGIRVCTGTGLGAALSTCLQVWLFQGLSVKLVIVNFFCRVLTGELRFYLTKFNLKVHYPVTQVFNLDRLRSRKDLWANNFGPYQNEPGARASHSVGLQSERLVFSFAYKPILTCLCRWPTRRNEVDQRDIPLMGCWSCFHHIQFPRESGNDGGL